MSLHRITCAKTVNLSKVFIILFRDIMSMLFISRIRLKNFKSFKVLNVSLPSTFLCLAGPNGSGKSNVVDSIRFALGESSLKSLRAKAVRDLIHTGAKTAEVTLDFDGDEKLEVKRAIREDGKMLYLLNGKTTTKRSILETLKKHNLDESGRNIIAQGEVQRFLNMSGKERRTIIDSVAGISDFEAKKKESVRELEAVEGRIKDSNLVMGERMAFLEELKREKEQAIKYTDMRDQLKNSKGTILKRQLENLASEKKKIAEDEQELISKRNKLQAEMDSLQEKISEIEKKRYELNTKLQSKQKTNEMIRRIEELKAKIGSLEQLIEDRGETIRKLDAEKQSLNSAVLEETSELEKLAEDTEKFGRNLAEAQEKLSSITGSKEDADAIRMRNELDAKESELSKARENLLMSEADLRSKKELIDAKRQELEGIADKQSESRTDDSELDRLRSEISQTESEIDQSFARTKEINKEISEIDRELLEMKEKASIFKVRSSPHLANPALALIKDLKQTEEGIHGTVADLISFDPKYAPAVEAAAGGRLLYVVVDHMDTATSVIQRLKKAKAGRATFIPLLGIKQSRPVSANGFGSVLDVIDFPEELRPAMEYVFAETLLVDSVDDAKSTGVGKMRMVTADGEIFERSGIISGGRSASSILMGKQLKAIEEKLSSLKSRKDGLVQDLYSIREEESRLRSHKSKLEVELKSLDFENRQMEEQEKEIERLRKRKAELSGQINELESACANKETEISNLRGLSARLKTEVDKLSAKLSDEEEKFREENESVAKQREEAAAEVSSLRAKLEASKNEETLRKKELDAKNERIAQVSSNIDGYNAEITESSKELGRIRGELLENEQKIAKASKEIEGIFAQVKELEQKLQALGKENGEFRIGLDRINKDLNQVEIRKATNSTKLDDVESEFSTYGEFTELRDQSDDELRTMMGAADRVLAEMGNVNMAAIEMYDKKKAEIDDVKDKIEKLSDERRAIFQMINEIEEHKKEAFFETFYSVSENFKKMFGYVSHMGEGYLFLDKPNDPFESGMHIKIKRNGHEHSLNSLSGGEVTIVALMFIFALQFYKPSPFYILDEVDAALDKPNSKNLSEMSRNIAKDSQTIMVSHNDLIMSNAETVLGVAKAEGASKLVGVKLKQAMENKAV
jgi:chromosome segregation protein